MEIINQLIKRYIEYYPQETNNISPLFDQLNSSSDLFDRGTLPGHITASAIVIESNKILMIYHPFLKKWLQPGGHVEQAEMPLETAKRELLEETGFLARLHPWHETYLIPFDIDIHLIPINEKKGEKAHLHYDFRYLLCLDKNSLINDQKDHELDWIDFEKIEEGSIINLLKKFQDQDLASIVPINL